MRILLRTLLVIVSLVALLLAGSPLLLYHWGLSTVDGRPQRPSQMADASEQARIWKQAGGRGAASIEPMNPYGFIVRFMSDTYPAPAGEMAAYWIARSYLSAHRREQGSTAWHVGVSALTIWITRNWSTEEILTVASQTVSADRRAPLRTPR